MTERRLLGYVEVDSGTLVVGDPGYVLPFAEGGKPGVDYQAVIDARGGVGWLGGTAVLLLQEFGGDGSYPVFGEFEDGRLVSVTVELVEPDDDDEPDERPELPASIERPLRVSGAVWGHLVGDAVGVPYEFLDAAAIGEVRFAAKGTHRQPPGTWSDDGALMLALLESLLEAGFDTADQGRRALAWQKEGRFTPDGTVFDIGNATRTALVALARGVPAEQAGPADERSGGNGSLMRILPLALVDRSLDAAALVDRAHRASRVTHGHARPQVACALYVLVARALLDAAETRIDALETSTETLRALYAEAGDTERLAALDHLLAYEDRGGRGRVWDSFWSAWDAFEGADSYRETIERAIAYGNDTDTTAAIAGGLAGLWWGLDGIPPDWLAGMRGKEIATLLVDRLIARDGWRTSTDNPIRVAWVTDGAGDEGRLGITFLPGKRDPAGHRARHWRTLETDAAELARQGVGGLLVLVEDHELETLRVRELEGALDRVGIRVARFPIPDLAVPGDYDAFVRNALGRLHQWMRLGGDAVVACRGGLGRSGLVAACLLVDRGMAPADAIRQVRRHRPGAIETAEQEQFVHRHVSRGSRRPPPA